MLCNCLEPVKTYQIFRERGSRCVYCKRYANIQVCKLTHDTVALPPFHKQNKNQFLGYVNACLLMRYFICFLSDSVPPMVVCVGGFSKNGHTAALSGDMHAKPGHHEWSFSEHIHTHCQVVNHFHMLDLFTINLMSRAGGKKGSVQSLFRFSDACQSSKNGKVLHLCIL